MFPAAFAQQSQATTDDVEVARLANSHQGASSTASNFGTATPNSQGYVSQYGSDSDDTDDTTDQNILSLIKTRMESQPLAVPSVKTEIEEAPNIEFRSIDNDSMTTEMASSSKVGRKRKNGNSGVLIESPVNRAKKTTRSSGKTAQMNDDVILIDDEIDTEQPSTSAQSQERQNPDTNFDTLLEKHAKASSELKKCEEKWKSLKEEQETIKTKLKKRKSNMKESDYGGLLDEYAEIAVNIGKCEERFKVLSAQKDTIKEKIKSWQKSTH